MMATIAWQQSHLLLLHAGLISGVKRDLERTQAFSQMPSTFCRRQGWLKESTVDEELESTFALEERWRRWRDREEIKRLGFAAIVRLRLPAVHSFALTLFTIGRCSEAWGVRCGTLTPHSSTSTRPGRVCPAMTLSGFVFRTKHWTTRLLTTLLQEASSSPAWQALFRGSVLPAQGIDTLTAINQVSDRSLHNSEGLLAASRDSFAMGVVLTVLHVLGASKLRESHSTSLFLPAAVHFEKTFSPVQAALDAGLEFFEVRSADQSPRS